MLSRVTTSCQKPLWLGTKLLANDDCCTQGVGVVCILAGFAPALISTAALFGASFSPFREAFGDATEKRLGRSFTLLTLNFCALPGCLPRLFGGVFPWDRRIDHLVKLLNANDPDVITLQEIFDIACAYALMKSLRKKYAYFYYNIGPCTIGFNSGLFVASKIAI